MDDSLAIMMAQRPAGIVAVHGPDAVPMALALAARAGAHGPLWVIDGGNRFDALWVADYLARMGIAPEPALARIRVSRAFTCHQMAERVLSLPAEGQADPLLMLDWLDTFYDENVPLAEARRLLNRIWPVLRRRSCTAPVVLVVRRPRSERVAERGRFYHVCLELAGQCVEAGLIIPHPPHPPLLAWEGEGDEGERGSRKAAGVGGEE
jgi:hypothetical protein